MNYLSILEEPFFERSDFTPIFGFDGAVVITCSDVRKKLFCERAEKLGIKTAIFPGYVWSWEDVISLGFLEDFKDLNYFYEKRDEPGTMLGHLGCTNSHLKIISEAKRLGLKSILIFEDDAWFVPHWNNVMSKVEEELKNLDWKILYLGTYPCGKGIKVTEHLSKIEGCWSTTAYAIHESFYDYVLNSNMRVGPVDAFYFHDSHYNNYYIVNECLNHQRHPEEENVSFIGGHSKSWYHEYNSTEDNYDLNVRHLDEPVKNREVPD